MLPICRSGGRVRILVIAVWKLPAAASRGKPFDIFATKPAESPLDYFVPCGPVGDVAFLDGGCHQVGKKVGGAGETWGA